ncbi:MAG: hypothetical protein U1F26_00075 [Lysobacterales bacterium]
MLWLLLGWPAALGAHELQANRATLVLRDRQHVQLSLYVDLIPALAQALAPEQPASEFLLAAAAMPPEAFADWYHDGVLRLQKDTVVKDADGQRLTVTHWQWPAAEDLRQSLQTWTMEALVAPTAHHHAIISEVRAEASAGRVMSGLSLRLPTAFGDVLVVWYQPQQQVLQAGTEGQLRFTDPAR